jgi:hypothetical protein
MFNSGFNAALNRNRSSRTSARSPRPVRRENNDRWYYQQNGVKLLQISQDSNQNMVNVTVLRYTSASSMFSTNTVWKLPFRLKHLKAFLMHPVLSEEEKEALTDRLTGVSTDQFKFEHLMVHRLNAICKALPIESPWQSYTKGISVDNDWDVRLFAESSYNSLIREVLEKNGLRSVI